MMRQEYKLHHAPAGANLLQVMTQEGKNGWILCPVPVKKSIDHDTYMMRREVAYIVDDEPNLRRIAGNELLMRCVDFLEGFKDDPDQAPVVPDLIRDIYQFVEGPAP